MPSRRHAAVLAALLLCSTLPLLAQDWRGRGRLQGTVTDEAGKPVAGATITLRKGHPPVKAEAPGPPSLKTDAKGKWSMLGLGGGAWGVLIEKQGFIVSEGQANVEEEGLVPPLNITLKAIPKEQAQAQAEAEDKTPTKGSQAIAAINDGNAALQQEKYAAARESYEKAIALLDPPNQVPVLRAVAATYYRESTQAKTKEEKTQKVDQSIATLKQALAIKPDDPEALQLIVNLLVGAGREAEAQPYMAQLPQGTKVDPDTLLNLGIKYYNEKKIDQALQEFDHVVADNPDLAEAYYYRGLVYLNKGKVPEAKADFQKLLTLDPNNKFAKDAREYLKSL